MPKTPGPAAAGAEPPPEPVPPPAGDPQDPATPAGETGAANAPLPPDVPAMAIERVALDDLVPDPRNARKGDTKAIAESLREFGQHRPVVVQRGTNRVIAGNHLVKAARVLGWSHVNVFYVDDDDPTAIRRALTDNTTGDRATWNDELLAELLKEAGPVPGYGQTAIDRLLDKLTPKIEPEAIYPILARPNEKYDYVLVVATSEMDWAFLETFFQLRKEQSYKRDKVALSHVVTVERLHEILGEREQTAAPAAEPPA